MRKIIATSTVFLISAILGFLFFVSDPRSEVSSLQERVKVLQQKQESAPTNTKSPKPSKDSIDKALTDAIKASGIEVQEINRLDTRIEVVAEGEPVQITLFTQKVSSTLLQATAISGDALPLYVITVVPKYVLARQ